MAQSYVCPGGNNFNGISCPDVCNRTFPSNIPGDCITEINGFRGCNHLKSYHNVQSQPETAVKNFIVYFQKNLRTDIVKLDITVKENDDYSIIKNQIITQIILFYESVDNNFSNIDLNIYSLYKNNTDVIITSFASLVENSIYTYRLPDKIFPCSASEWDTTKLALLRIVINHVSSVNDLLELLPSAMTITPRANSLKMLLKHLNHSSVYNFNESVFCGNIFNLEECQAQLNLEVVF